MYTPEQINTAEEHLRQYIRQNRSAARQYETFLQEYQELDEVLASMPGKIRHPIMVPISTVAFMEGQIEQTNELTVLLGDNYFVKCTAAHARSILHRRMDFTTEKLKSLQEEYRLVSSRVGLAHQWLDVSEDVEADNEELQQLKMPGKSEMSSKPKPKIEVIESKDFEEDEELSKRRAKIRELEASGVEMTDEELAKALGTQVPDLLGDAGPVWDESNTVEIMEHYKPDGTVETYVTPKPSASPEKRAKFAPGPILEHDAERDVLPAIVPTPGTSTTVEEAPKRVSKFKAMREQNRS